MKSAKLSQQIVLRHKTFLPLLSLFAIFGTALEISGGIWDASSHAIRAPEYFWSIPHVVVYFGVSLTACSGILGFVFLKERAVSGTLKKGIILVMAGSCTQIISGYGDSLSHDVFGIDGLLSLTHQPLEIGLVLSCIGAFLIYSRSGFRFRIFSPIVILTMMCSVIWLGFNFALYFASPILCLIPYYLFSSGCAVM